MEYVNPWYVGKLSKKRLKLPQKFESQQIILINTGSRIKSIAIEIFEGPYTIIPLEYKQSSYHVKMDMVGLLHAF